MKISRFLILSATIVVCTSLRAAPVESVEAACASASFQKVSGFLSEKVVVDQLAALGLSQQQAQARLAGLSDAQIDQLAVQVDLIRAGGTIQRSGQNPLGPLRCSYKHLCTFAYDLLQFLFCWGDLR